MAVHTGLAAQLTRTVSEADTAAALGSGEVPVLATPRLISWCEAATMEATAPMLREGETTVGSRIEFSHVAAVAVGSTVIAEALLERVEGRRLVFSVSVSDACGLVGAGRITRVVVNRAAFVERAR
jgi:fluoroacetyl-CoA thioesterase